MVIAPSRSDSACEKEYGGLILKDPDKTTIEKLVKAALAEDGAWWDATIELAGIGDEHVGADVVAGRDGVICGIGFADQAFCQMDASVAFRSFVADGDNCQEGDVVMHIEGPARAILAAERVALNFVQRMSGIATLAAIYAGRVAGTGVTILDTRKTTPLWRDLEKYAVRCGGAQNHRRDLRSMVLVKENHVRAIGGPDALIKRLESLVKSEDQFVEVEVDSIEFLRKLLGAPIDRVMLDNFSPAQVREALVLIAAYKNDHKEQRLEVEVSGGITLENIDDYALEGVDYISVGALTHSAPALPMSLEVS
jgi:nicotinate-nucleotide pyrophosphorylase (carboxylating)